MKLQRFFLPLLSAMAVLPTAASAATFSLTYSAFFATPADAITVQAILTAEPDPFSPNVYNVSAISGTRNGVSITAIDSFYNEFYYPAAQPQLYSFQTYLDDAFVQLTFTAGGIDYNVYRASTDTNFYHEFGNATGRLITPDNFSLMPTAMSAVPESATWTMMIAGFGILGISLRPLNRRTIDRETAS